MAQSDKKQSETRFDDDDSEIVSPLSPAEAKALARNRDALNTIFKDITADKSEISISELKTALGKHGISVKDNKELEHYFNSMDSDKDKRVTFQDFYVKFAPISEEKSSTDAKVLFDTWIMKNAKPYVQHSDDAWKYLVSGGVSGAVSRTATAPIERIKLLQQVQGIKDLSSNTSIATKHAPPQYPGIWKSLVKIGQEEGFVGYFKGNFTNVVRAAPSAAVRFSSFEFFKALFLHPTRNPNKRKHLSDMENLAAGAGAGLISTVATYPLDLLRSRLCVQTVNAKYRGLGHAFQVVWKEEGARGFFKGVGTSAYGAVPYVALNFTFYEWLKQRMMRPGEDRPSQLVSLTCGGVSGSVAMTMTYAFELIRRRMMIQGVDGMPVLYNSTMDALVKIYRQEGMRGLHQGLWANYFKVIPSMAIGFWTYELCKSTFNLK